MFSNRKKEHVRHSGHNKDDTGVRKRCKRAQNIKQHGHRGDAQTENTKLTDAQKLTNKPRRHAKRSQKSQIVISERREGGGVVTCAKLDGKWMKTEKSCKMLRPEVIKNM